MHGRLIFIRTLLYKPSSSLFSFSASSLFSNSRCRQPTLDLKTCIALVQSCANNRRLSKGKEIHSYMLINEFLRFPFSVTSLINMYSKCGSLEHALKVFDYQTSDRNVYVYNAIIAGLVSHGVSEYGFKLYKQMRLAGVVPDRFTFPCVIRACSDVSEGLEINKIHGLLVKFGLELDVFIGSALVSTYLKFQLMGEAQEMFEELPVKDVVLWNSMVNGYSQIGRFEEALEFFRNIHRKGMVPGFFAVTGVLSIFAVMGDFHNGTAVHGFVTKMGYDSGVAVCNSLIDMYGKCKCVDDASSIFEMMDEKDIFSWNSIIVVHGQSGNHDRMLWLFNRMLGSGVQPDLVTLTALLPACCHLAALAHGIQIHRYMIVTGLGKNGTISDTEHLLVKNSVMDMYAKCGNLRAARAVFDNMGYNDIASWNIMIMGYGMHGDGDEALNMFHCMCEAQVKPDGVTFISVLSACSHSGMIKRGRELLNQMERKHRVPPSVEHYACVIDMLGRAGQLDEAYKLALSMPVKDNPVVWRALLAACQLHRNTNLAEVAVRRVIELDPEHCGSYVLMSNLYGVGGRYEEVSVVRQKMRECRVQKTPGCSWIELNNNIHAFITGDRTLPETDELYASLNSLTARLQEHGYVPTM